MRITVKSWNKFTIKSNRGIIMELIYNNILNTNNVRYYGLGAYMLKR